MGIFGFFKKKNKKPQVEETVEVERVKFDDLSKWVKSSEKEFSEAEGDFFGIVGPKIDDFVRDIEPKLEVLEGIDIESKKEYEKAKILVRQGLNNYMNLVRVLVKDLDNLERENLRVFAKSLSAKFTNFEKSSFKFYERATYLVGEEMVEARTFIRDFYKDVLKDIKDNEELLKRIQKVEAVRSKLEEFEEELEIRQKLEEEIEKSERRIEKDKKSVGKIEKDIDKIKSSEEYTKNKRVEEEVNNLRSELSSEVLKFKEMIDFKRLSNIVHTNRKELELVKSYKDHFSAEFSKDMGKKIIHLLEDNRLKTEEMNQQLKVINAKGLELEEKRKEVGVDSTTVKWNEIRRFEEEIEKLQNENVRQSRKLEEVVLKVKGLRSEVVGLVGDMGVVVE